MDPELTREVLDVRKAIERNTSKVSLRDLEKKGYRQVKVLRAGDINQLIFKAVQSVLAKAPRGAAMSEEERQQVMREAKAELDQKLAEHRALEARAQQVQEAHHNLELKLAEVNRQLEAEKKSVLAEKAAFQRDKQALMERSLEGQKVAAGNYEGQLRDLRERLARAEAKAEASNGAVPREEHDRVLAQLARAEAKADAAADAIPREEHEQVRRRLSTQVDDLENDVERYRKQLRQLEEENADVGRLRSAAKEGEELQGEVVRLRRRAVELEEEGSRAQSKARSLADDVERLEAEVARLKAELAEAKEHAAPAADTASDAELQRIRQEFEQRQAQMQEMLAGIATSLVEARNVPAEPGAAPDFSKQFERLQLSIGDAVRKAAGRQGAGGLAGDLTAEQAAALFTNMDVATLETNVRDIEIKEQSAAGVKDKLAKLRNLRKQ